MGSRDAGLSRTVLLWIDLGKLVHRFMIGTDSVQVYLGVSVWVYRRWFLWLYQGLFLWLYHGQFFSLFLIKNSFWMFKFVLLGVAFGWVYHRKFPHYLSECITDDPLLQNCPHSQGNIISRSCKEMFHEGWDTCKRFREVFFCVCGVHLLHSLK